MFLFLSYSINGYASPSFDCQKAKTNIEKTICQNKALSDLDNALNIIYKKACELSPNNSQVKLEQKAWLKKRNNQEIIRENYVGNLIDIYGDRILELLKDQKPCYFFLKEFINSPIKNHHVIYDLAIMALWKTTSGEIDSFNLIEDLITDPLIMPIAKQTVIIALMTNSGAHREGYTFFKIYEKNKEIKIEPFSLPQLKIFPLKMAKIAIEKDSNYLIGNFNPTKQNGKYLLYYNSHPSTYERGDSCIFQIDENGMKIINEWYSCDFIAVNTTSDLQKIAIKKIHNPTLVLIKEANVIYIYDIICSYDKDLKFKLNRVSIPVDEAKQLGLNVSFPDVGKDAETKDIEKGIIDKLILKQIDKNGIEVIKEFPYNQYDTENLWKP